MTQINIRLEDELGEIIEYLAKRRSVPRAVVAREILVKNLSHDIFDILVEDYKEGKIGLKTVIKLSRLAPRDVMDKIAKLGVEPPITEELDDYTKKIADKLMERLANHE